MAAGQPAATDHVAKGPRLVAPREEPGTRAGGCCVRPRCEGRGVRRRATLSAHGVSDGGRVVAEGCVPTSVRRLDSLTGMRFVAAFAVFLYHVRLEGIQWAPLVGFRWG